MEIRRAGSATPFSHSPGQASSHIQNPLLYTLCALEKSLDISSIRPFYIANNLRLTRGHHSIHLDIFEIKNNLLG